MRKEEPTLPDLIEEYLEYCLHVRELSRNSITAFRSDLRCFLKYAGKMELSSYDARRLQGYFLHLKRDKRLASETVHRRRMTLSGFGKWLVGLRLLKSNPMDRVQFGRRIRRTRQSVYSVDETVAFLVAEAQVPVHPGCQQLLKYLLTFTGMRRSEVLGLKWAHVDLDNEVLSVYNSKWTTAKGHPDGLDRHIPLATSLVQEMDQVRQAARPAQDDVVILGNTDRALSRDQFSKAVRAWTQVSGLAGATAHCFRHSLASNLVMRGASEEDVAALLGHGNRTVTQGYIHTTLVRLRSLLESYAAEVVQSPLSGEPVPQRVRTHQPSAVVNDLAGQFEKMPVSPHMESLWATISAVAAPSLDPKIAFILGMLAAGARSEKPG